MAIDLEFGQAPADPGSPVELLFGADDGPAAGTGIVHLAGQLTGLRGHVAVRTLARTHASAQLTGLRGHVALGFDINVSRPLARTARLAWQRAAQASAATQSRFEQAGRLGVPLAVLWQQARPLGTSRAIGWESAQPLQQCVRAQYQQAARLGAAPSQQRFEAAERLQQQLRQQYQQARALACAPVQQRFEAAERLRQLAREQYQSAAHLGTHVRQQLGVAVQVALVRRQHYQLAARPAPGATPRPEPPNPQPCYVPGLPAELVFADRADSGVPMQLFLYCDQSGPTLPPASVVVPARRSYIVINSIEIRRADALLGDPLPSETFQMQLDRQSWTWTFSAGFHASARDALMPGLDGQPVELEVRVNGQPFRLQAERIGRSKRFPGHLVTVAGRGLAAVLDAPHAPVQTFSQASGRTAHQLMMEVLTVNGVGFGWSVDWQLTDWQVPGGVWLHQGTWISALANIAGAAGGYLQPHDTDPLLHVLPLWPQPWWRWDTLAPDIELPDGIAEITEIEVIDLPAYDRIIVAGEAGGIQADLTREGMPGTLLKQPMVVHPLLTDLLANKQRATAELAESGRMIKHKMTMPILPATGVIKPGKVLRYVDDAATLRLGIVRATAISQAFPVLTQSLEIDSHA